MEQFRKILVANRGEIAVRIIKSAKKLGIKTVAIYSKVDEGLLNVEMADESYCIGEVELSETYLNIKKIIEVAKSSKCEAIHPGYGFLAENADFVKACEDTNIVFIGPNSKAIKLMGNKIKAREFVQSTGVQVTVGVTGDKSTLLQAGKKIPFPLLVKAAAGGGGKGMRIVCNDKELEEAIESTSREAKSYFGDGTVYIEKFIESPRHIEIQVIGDNHGNVVHLFERECSIQRRYQKIIEESPSITLNDSIRNTMGEAAVKIAKEIGYNNAGTIEFMVDKDLNFFFLEMNTRIQVEHPVTELVTGIDIVEEQLSIAAGNKLRLIQKEITQNGHAIECRIYAEDPANDFIPSPGDMSLYKEPEGVDIRVDSGIAKSLTIESFYDPMISKLIVWGENRDQAIDKMIAALKEFIVHGIKTNISYLITLMGHNAYVTNSISTKFCDEYTKEIIKKIEEERNSNDSFVPLLAFLLFDLNNNKINTTSSDYSVWNEIGYWREIMEVQLKLEEEEYQVEISNSYNGNYEFSIGGDKYRAYIKNLTKEFIDVVINDTYYKVFVSKSQKGDSYLSLDGNVFSAKRLDILNSDYESRGLSEFAKDGNTLNSPMPGKIIKVNVNEGDSVKKNDILMIIEAMKMENNIVANKDAVIEKIAAKEGEMVGGDVPLIILKEDSN